MVGAPENLALLRHGCNDRFERGTAICVAKSPGLNFLDDLPDALADGTEILEPLRLEKPCLESPGGVRFPVFDQRVETIHILTFLACR